MPSPLSGFTQPAASPISAQLGPATLLTAPPIGSSAEVGRPQVAARARTPRGAARRRSAISGLIAMSAGPLGGGQGADADVHLAGRRAQREDPAVAGQDLAVLAAQLQVGADPRVVGIARSRRRSGRRRRRRCRGATRDPAPCPAASGPRRPRPAACRRSRTVAVAASLKHHGGDPVAVAAYVDRAGAVDRDARPPRSRCVRRWSSSSVRATARAPVGQRAARPGQQQGLAEAVGAQPLVDGVGRAASPRGRAAAARRSRAG